MLLCDYLKNPTTLKHGTQWLKRILKSLRFILGFTNSILSMVFSIQLSVKLLISVHVNIKVIREKMNGGWDLNPKVSLFESLNKPIARNSVKLT